MVPRSMKPPPQNVPLLTDVVHEPPPRWVVHQTLSDHQLPKLSCIMLHLRLHEQYYQVQLSTARGIWAMFRLSLVPLPEIQQANDLLRMKIQKYGDIRGYRLLVAGCRKNT